MLTKDATITLVPGTIGHSGRAASTTCPPPNPPGGSGGDDNSGTPVVVTGDPCGIIGVGCYTVVLSPRVYTCRCP